MKVAKFLFYLAYLSLALSCSHYSPVQEGSLKITSSSAHTEKQQKFKVIVETENLLWGIVPGSYPIDLYEKLELAKYKAVGGITIKSYQTIVQKSLMILSLGVYIPESLEFEFWGDYVVTD